MQALSSLTGIAFSTQSTQKSRREKALKNRRVPSFVNLVPLMVNSFLFEYGRIPNKKSQ